MKLLILGGSPSRAGGVEAFCRRASEAVNLRSGYPSDWLPTNTAYLRPKTLGPMLQSLGAFWQRRNEGWDAIWLQYVNIGDLAFLLVGRLMGAKVIVTPHLGSNWVSTRIAFLKHLSCFLLSFSSKIAYLSETQLAELTLPSSVPRYRIRTFLPKSIGTQSLKIETKKPSKKIRLIHASRLSHEKGTFRFVDLCARLALKKFPFAAEIIGSCDDATRYDLQQMIAAHELNERITLYNAMQEDELMEKLATADILVHLSVMDSFPLIVLEAIAVGLYPICIDLPGARDIAKIYCGRVVDIANPVQSAVDIIVNSDLSAMTHEANQARERISEDYSWATCVALLESCIAKMP